MKLAPIQSLETEFRKVGNSWMSYAGAVFFTLVLFILIGSTRSGFVRSTSESGADLIYHYLPPPQADVQKPIPLASKPEASFKFDFPDPVDVTEKVPVDLLDLELSLNPMAESDIVLSLEGRFTPAKPNIVQRFVIYNSDQVDEKPVRLYAANIAIPEKLRRSGAKLFVLYRVTDRGRTENVHILNTDQPEATELARSIILSSRFRPARKDGQPVNVWVQHEMNFTSNPFATPFSL